MQRYLNTRDRHGNIEVHQGNDLDGHQGNDLDVHQGSNLEVHPEEKRALGKVTPRHSPSVYEQDEHEVRPTFVTPASGPPTQ